jgi:hypothetical protein
MACSDTGSPAITRTSTQFRMSDLIARSQKGSPPRERASPEPIEETSMNRFTRFSVRPGPAPERSDS